MLRGVRMMFGAEPGDRLDRFFKPAGSTLRHPFQALAVTGRHMQWALRVPPGSCCGDSRRTRRRTRGKSAGALFSESRWMQTPPGRRTLGPDGRPRTGHRRSISIRSGGSDDRGDRRSRDGSFCDWSRNFRLPLPRPRRPGRRQQPRRSRPRLGRFHRQRQFGMTRRAIPRLREQDSFLTLRPSAKAANPRPLFAS